MCRQEVRSAISPSVTSNLKHSHWGLKPTGRSMSSGSHRTSMSSGSYRTSTYPDPWTVSRSLVLEIQKWPMVLLPMRKIFKKRIPKSHLKVCPEIALWVKLWEIIQGIRTSHLSIFFHLFFIVHKAIFQI